MIINSCYFYVSEWAKLQAADHAIFLQLALGTLNLNTFKFSDERVNTVNL